MSRPWMPLYVADYLRDTRRLNAAEHGAYLLLIMEYWTVGSLPNDDSQLARIACMSPSEWKRARNAIVGFFQSNWKHKRIEEELAHAEQISSKRRASALGRHSKRHANAPQVYPQLDTHAGLVVSSLPSLVSPSEVQQRKEEIGDGQNGDWPSDYREKFWAEFPNKIGKASALSKLDRLKKQGLVSWSALMAGLSKYVAKTDDRPWCNPETWINQQRWTDEPAVFSGAGNVHRTNSNGQSRPSDFFAGLKSVAEDIAGDGHMAEPTSEEIPSGRFEIDG